jgi:hypothetical protein
MIGNCMADDCNKVGNEVIPGIVLCRSHRKRTYYSVWRTTGRVRWLEAGTP